MWLRWKSAVAIANAPVMPVATSAAAKPARIGPLTGSPVRFISPDIAWILPSKLAVRRSGPVEPKPDIST